MYAKWLPSEITITVPVLPRLLRPMGSATGGSRGSMDPPEYNWGVQ